MACVELGGSGQEPGAGRTALVCQDLGIGEPGVVVDCGMHVVEPDAAVPTMPAGVVAARLAAAPPATTVRDPAKLLDVNMDQVAGSGSFIAQSASPGGADLGPGDGVELEQFRQAGAGDDPGRGRGADPDALSKLRWPQPFPDPQLEQLLPDRGRGSCRRPPWS